ncbi:MAG: carboxypeptidase-like regulatory domain-containing protein [Mucilaginibacter sp.]
MKYLICIFFLIFTTAAFAQQQDKPLVQFSGVTHNADSTQVIVPYVTITNTATGKSITSTNYKGYFSFVAHERDTLQFTSVGYASVTVVIPANTNKSYTVQVLLKPQIINLPVFRVFPWATTDEFRKDFLAMKVADDDLEIARKNVSRSSLMALQNTLARDGREIQSANAQSFHNRIVNQNSLMPNPLLNPLAWGSLIKQISAGDKSRGSE